MISPLKFKKLKTSFLNNFEKQNDLDGNLIWEDKQLELKTEIENSVNNSEIPDFLTDKILIDLLDIEKEYDQFAKGLRLDLIKGQIADKNEINVIGDEACPGLRFDVKMPHARATTKELLAKLEADNPQIFVSMKAAFSNFQPATFFKKEDLKGYTGHEQLPSHNLVHMNARLYDPVIARFLQADTVIPDISDPLAYNRYIYVKNNRIMKLRFS